MGDAGQTPEALGNLILAMREDVGLSNKGLALGADKVVSKGTIVGARCLTQDPELFLKLLRKNPSMPMDRRSALEKEEDARRRGLPS